jgi:hypothetical protein
MALRPPECRPDKHFTPFYSAAEEAFAAKGHESWDNEAGHVSSLRGCIVNVPGADLAYKVLLMRRGRPDTEHRFATMHEAEAFIRRNSRVSEQRPMPDDPDAAEVVS